MKTIIQTYSVTYSTVSLILQNDVLDYFCVERNLTFHDEYAFRSQRSYM